MKKFVAMMLAVMMLVSLTACGGDSAEPTTPATDASAEAPKLEGTLEEIIIKIYEQKPVEVMGLGSIPVDLTDTSEDGLWNLTRFTGLTSFDGISEVAVSESMIGSVAYSLVLVRAADAANTQTIAQSMKDGIDPAKWVCVVADDMAACGYGDVAMLVMMGSELGSEIGVTAQDLVDAFKTVCGGELSFVIE